MGNGICGGGEGPEKPKTENLENISDDMAEVPVIPELEATYQSKPYKSIEQKIFVDSGIRDFAGEFIEWGVKSAYGTTISYFRIPTFIRKLKNKQRIWNEWEPKYDETSKDVGRFFGGIFGGVSGIIGGICFSFYSISEAVDNNYIPLAILGATNILLSGFYELGRLSKSKQERLEVKAEQEAIAQEKEARLKREGSGGGGN